MVQKDLCDGLVSIGHGPHQRAPLIAILLVNKSTGVEKCGNHVLMAL
jgi:hypothetical protein